MRRELRLNDNTALVEAAEDFDKVLPLYIIDSDIFNDNGLKPGFDRVFFWYNSLKNLIQRFRDWGGLVIRVGKPEVVLNNLVGEVDAQAIYFNSDYTPYSRKRDQKVLNFIDIEFKGFKDLVFHEKKEILTGSNTPYKVFSYYEKKWNDLEKKKPTSIADFNTLDVSDEGLPSLKELGYDEKGYDEKGSDNPLFRGGRSRGLSLLDSFKERVGSYHEFRDYPGMEWTSLLSPHLKFGTISIREAYWIDDDDSKGLNAWRRQLCWRDFYFQQLWNWPEMYKTPLKKKYTEIDWRDVNQEWDAFKKGETGFPLIDAGVRQLLETGWMHNRVRMAVASFVAKDLHLDWRVLDSFFKKHFIDFERASMTGGIHWCYSIGGDSQPYFRVFNPTKQAKKYDPEGSYIKSYIPELQMVPNEYIHKPDEMSEELQRDIGCIVGEDYPKPVLKHKERRKKAIELYESVK
ncbi:cryptochrome/photolyase family protein [Methanonatronarchaeum thermophilum]|uniref:cryptochrome/photolyase family protein n=1 Tax=Methanonatronarchaeum thermophilum TaxID=1927129 RepID=UPI00117B6AE3|nr:deoxyribodipyrimidine photo-lyase [Methanonatronarchaeum thermophilum]